MHIITDFASESIIPHSRYATAPLSQGSNT